MNDHYRLERRTRSAASEAPQFGVRVLLAMLTSCAAAFAILGAESHDYLDVAAAMVIVFWMGTTLAFVGLVLDRHGDLWFAPASLAESIGLGTIVIALFTGAYYGVMFILVTVTMSMYS